VNFIMLAAGGDKNWVPLNIDVDGLDTDELRELLTDAIDYVHDKKSKSYPLGGHGQKMAVRSNFCKIWDTLASRALVASSSDRIFGCVTEILVSLSGLPLSSLRDAVTEGALCVGRVLVCACLDLRRKSAGSGRQLSSADGVRARGGAGGNKSRAIQAMQTDTRRSLKAYEDAVMGIFNSVFVHRYRDTSDIVRARCAWYLGEWLVADPERLYDDQYLKYIGWMCSDRSHYVRAESVVAINKLMTKKQHITRLTNFAERFMSRFVEMAVGDVNEQVSLDTIELLRSFQMYGMLDTVEQSTLDDVDRVVFDASTSGRVRSAALAFVMEHTVGFEEEGSDDDDHTLETNGSTTSDTKYDKKKTGGKKRSRKSELVELAKRKRVAMQLETFAEFACHHLNLDEGGDADDASLVVLLADACLGLPGRADIVRSWDIMVHLLLKDSEDLIESALPSAHVSMLLRLFVASALSLKREKMKEEDLHKRRDQNLLDSDWNSLQGVLSASLPSLLTRFRGEDSELETLVDLLECYDTSAADGKRLQLLLRSCVEIMDAASSEAVLVKIGGAMKGWFAKGRQHKAVVGVLRGVMKGCWDKIAAAVGVLTEYLNKRRRKSLAKKGPDTASTRAATDALFSLSSSCRKYMTLWQCMDCRNIGTEGIEDICDTLTEVSTVATSLLSLGSTGNIKGADIVSAAISSGRTMLSLLLWQTRDVYTRAKENLDSEDDITGDAAAKESIDGVLSVREKIVDILSVWMDLTENSADSSEHCRQLQCEAFRMLGDMRLLFPLKEKDYKYVASLAWTPSRELVERMERVFTTEESRIRNSLSDLRESGEDEDGDAARKLSRQLVENLLCPLSGIVYDVDNMNRRQAAAVLGYISNPSQEVQRLVKAWAKKLKDSNAGKYLESVLVALKKCYEDHVVPILLKIDDMDESRFDSDEDLMYDLDVSKSESVEFAQRMMQTLGVGKVKSHMRELLGLFFQVGIKYALESVHNMGFLALLQPFIKLLPRGDLELVAQHLEEALEESSNDVQYRAQEEGANDDFLAQAFRDFSAHVGAVCSRPVPGRTKESVKSSPASSKRRRVGTASRTAASRISYKEEETEDEDSEPEEIARPSSRRGRLSSQSSISALTQDSADFRPRSNLLQSRKRDSGTPDEKWRPILKDEEANGSRKRGKHSPSMRQDSSEKHSEERKARTSAVRASPGKNRSRGPVMGLHIEDFSAADEDIDMSPIPFRTSSAMDSSVFDEMDDFPSRRHL